MNDVVSISDSLSATVFSLITANTKDVISGEKTIGEAVAGTTIDTALGAAFGAIGSGSATEIAQSKQISSAGWNGVKTLLRSSVHPAVKATAKEAVKSATIYAGRTLGKEVLSGIAATGITKGTNWYGSKVYKNYVAAN